MAAPPPNPPDAPGRAPGSEAVEVRVAMLRAEVEAEAERPRQAQLHYEIGSLLERQLGSEAMAVREYLTAYNLDSGFRPPLFALLRVFERRRSFANLLRLYDAAAKGATTAEERSSAILDRAILLDDHLQQPADARPLYDEALEADPRSLSAALMLERAARAGADRDAVVRVLERRAALVEDPALQALLLVELGWERAADGDLDGAFEALREAAALPAGRWRSLDRMERLARKHGRSLELIEALEGRAVLAGAMAEGEDQGQASGAFSVQRFADQARASAEAAALWYESAQLRMALHADPEGAMQALEQAIALRPDDVLLHQERMLACELADDIGGAAAEARYLIEHGVSGRFAGALHFRLAELAQASDDPAAAAIALAAALEADPQSAAAASLLDDLLLDRGEHAQRVARLEERAAGDPEDRWSALFHAAQIASEQLGDFGRASALYRQAAEAAAGTDRKAAVLRELHGAALRHGDAAVAREAAEALLEITTDDEERSALLLDAYELAQASSAGDEGLLALLHRALDHRLAAAWAGDAARLHACSTGDDALLAKAHGVLAARADDEETAAAHLCAAARALTRAGDAEQAIARLRSALERSPGHRYAVALLEELLRSRGEAEEVVALLREAAAAQAGARAAEMNLLLAGAAAEASGDPALARKTYQEAADRDPTAVAPVLALRRLAQNTGDETLLRDSLEKLGELELGDGEPGLATFEIGEHYDLVVNKPELAESHLRSALGHPGVGLAAAAELLALPGKDVDGTARVAAAQRLLADGRDDAVAPLLRALAWEALASEGDPVQAEEALEALVEQRAGDRWGHLARMRLHARDATRSRSRADAWVALGQGSEESDTAAELMLHGLRALMVAEGAEAADDAFLVAQEIAAVAPDALSAGVALDETLSGGDDPELRAEALGARLSSVGKEGSTVLSAALGRALTASGRTGNGLANLRHAVAEDPDDLASWEALRVAAREEGAWEDVVRACDALAARVDGELKAQLLEEGAAVLMDDLGRDDEARVRLQTALSIDALRPISYGRLHDLLAEREDTRGLIDLVERRIDVVDDSDELVRLFYDQARLLRSEGDRPGALGALDSVLMLEADHVGALALKVEIHVSLEQWSDAVDALRALAQADVPPAQKRLAHIGAADFLEKRLGDPAGAVAELRKVVELGLGDAAFWGRIGEVAERGDMLEDAAAAFTSAAAAATGPARAGWERRAARLHGARGDDREAIAAFRRALAVTPDDLEAGGALAELLTDPDERRELSRGVEAAVRATLDRDPWDEDALRKLRETARWRGDRELERVAVGALVALGLALPDEEEHWEAARSARADQPSGTLGDGPLERLRAPGADDPVARVARAVEETLAEMDRLEPGSYGVGRGNLISAKADHPVRDEIFALAAAFGTENGDFYAGGSDAALIAAVPGKKGRTTWVVGDGVRAPLSAGQRFVVGQLAAAVREGTLPLVSRRSGEAATLIRAAAAAADSPLPGASPGETDDLRRGLERKMGRRTRRAVAEAAQAAAAAGGDVDVWARGALGTALRGGLLLACDPSVALQAVLGEAPSPEAVARSPEARDLLLFWLSHDLLALRRELGLAP